MKRACSVEGCNSRHSAKGYCAVHYQRVLRTGTVAGIGRGRRPRTAAVDRVLRRSEQQGECWVWVGKRSPDGYGSICAIEGSVNRSKLTHRVVYEALVGEIPEGLHLDHLCRNRACVNPWHLEPVTPLVNAVRARQVKWPKASLTHCCHGHLFDEANTYMRGTARVCRTCQAEDTRRYLARVASNLTREDLNT